MTFRPAYLSALTLACISLNLQAQLPPLAKRFLAIETLDASQAPLPNAPLVILARRQPHLQPWQGRTWGKHHEVVWRGRTNATGRISLTLKTILDEVQSYLEWRFGQRYDDDQVWAALDMPGAGHDPEFVSLCSRGAPKTARVKLVAPATGSLTVDVVRADGTAPADGLVAELHWPNKDGVNVTAVPVASGKATFTHVAVKTSLQIVLRDTNRLHRTTAPLSAPVPDHAAAHVRMQVKHGTLYPAIHATLKHGNGQVASNSSFFWCVTQGDAFIDSGHVQSDAAGNISCIVRRVPLPSAASPRLEVWPGTPSIRIQIMPPPEAKANIPLSPWPLAPGPIRLGDVTLESVPVLVKGLVINAAGKPIPYATIEVTVTPKGSKHPHIHQIDPEPDGTFALHLDPAAHEPEFELSARAPGFEKKTLPLKAGAPSLKITLSRPSR